MINYIRYKRNEWKVKAMFYGMIVGFMNEQEDIIGIIKLVKYLYGALKDVPMEDLQKELVTAITTIIHEENKKTEE